MMLTGKMVKANKAKQLGFVDMLVQPIGPGVAPSDVRTLEVLENAAVLKARYFAIFWVMDCFLFFNFILIQANSPRQVFPSVNSA